MWGLRTLGLACLVATVPAGSNAHHSYSMFDMETDITLEGTIKEFQWTNPHIWIQLLVTDESGQVVEWAIEGGSPNMLTRYGWTRHSLRPGERAVAVIHPLRKDAGLHKKGGGLGSISVNGQPVLSVRNIDTAAPAVK